jgi:hypothetical protein
MRDPASLAEDRSEERLASLLEKKCENLLRQPWQSEKDWWEPDDSEIVHQPSIKVAKRKSTMFKRKSAAAQKVRASARFSEAMVHSKSKGGEDAVEADICAQREIVAHLCHDLDTLLADMGRQAVQVRPTQTYDFKLFPHTARILELRIPQKRTEEEGTFMEIDCSLDPHHHVNLREHLFDVKVADT